jgi:N-acetylglutamate synthase/N-acetylornithine aminotransferase
MTDQQATSDESDEPVTQALEDDLLDSIELDGIESTDDLAAVIQHTNSRLDELEQEYDEMREQTVHTVAVEKVLLEYGLSAERVDEIVTTIEAVDEGLGGDDDV